jgi:glycosyltransferase involved in cell wall biosynthesis
MKVLHVLGAIYPERGGPAKVAPELCRALVERNIEASIYTTNLNITGYLNVPLNNFVLKDGVRIFHFPVSISRKYGYSRALGGKLKATVEEFDLVHIHSLYMYHSSAAAYYCRKGRVPYIIRPHGTLDPFLRNKSRMKKAIYNFLFEYRDLNHAAAIHYTSQGEKDLAHQAMNIQSPGIVVPIGINVEEYANLPEKGIFRRDYPELEGKFLFLFLGRIDFKKGLDLLCKSFAKIAYLHPDAHLVIAGPDETNYMAKVNGWLSELGVLDRMTYTGMLAGEKKLAAFQDADIFVLSSYTENFGVALVEALASGMPAVITNKINIWQEIDVAKAGLVTDCHDEDFMAGMLSLYTDPDLRAEMGRNARELAREKYDWDKNVELMIKAYLKIINRKKTLINHVIQISP